MTVLIIFNREPYDGTDVTWNGLRLADKLLDAGQKVRIFLMNDAVDMARDACRPPETYDQDLSAMLKALMARGVAVKVCGTCMVRCGIHKNQPYFEVPRARHSPSLLRGSSTATESSPSEIVFTRRKHLIVHAET